MLCFFPYFNKNLGLLLLLFEKDCSEKQYIETCYEHPPLDHKKSDHSRKVAVHRRFIQSRIQRHLPHGCKRKKTATFGPKYALKCTIWSLRCLPRPFVNSWTRHCHLYTECHFGEWSSGLAPIYSMYLNSCYQYIVHYHIQWTCGK